MNTELISKAVASRLAEVCERLQGFRGLDAADSFIDLPGNMLRSHGPAKWLFPPFPACDGWQEATMDCFTTLRLLPVVKEIETKSVPESPPVRPFLSKLEELTAARQSVFQELIERYCYPPNFSLATEEKVREFVLMRLMTYDRTRIESESVSAVDADELLLKLYLVAVYAATVKDLRFLDALNYYYELLPTPWHPQTENRWLLVSWLALYMRALLSWS